MMKNVLYIFLLFFISSVTSFADGRYVHVNRENYNLSCDLVRSIHRDSRGYIWIGTEMGLNRFDGVRMKQYKSDEYKLPSQYIFSISEDGKGNVWFGTSRGAACYDYQTDSFFVPTLDNGTYPEDIISSFAVASSGNIWFAPNMSETLYEYDYKSGYLTSFNLPVGLGPKYMTFDDRGMLVFISGNSIYEYDTKNKHLTSLYSREGDTHSLYERIRGPYVCKTNGLVYFATETSLQSLDRNTGNVMQLHGWKRGQIPLSLSKSSDDSFLVSTSTGVESYDIRTGKIETFFHDEHVVACHRYEDDLYIAATHDYGVKLYTDRLLRFQMTDMTEDGYALTDIEIMSMVSDGVGNVWIATKGSGLLKYEVPSGSLMRVLKYDLPDHLNVLCCDNELLWAGGVSGLYLVSLVDYKVTKVESSSVSRLVRTKGGEILVGDKHSLNILDAENFRLVPLDGFTLPPLTSQRSVVEDHEGNIWIPTYGAGLYSFCRSTGEVRQYIINKDNGYVGIPDMVTSVLVSSDGDVYSIGSDAQVSRIINGEIAVKYDRKSMPSLPDASYQNGVEDEYGRIWITTNSGLICLNPENESLVLFTDKNGLSTNVFTGPGCRLSDGDLLLATVKGLIRFSPSDFMEESYNVDIVSYIQGDDEVQTGKNINHVDKLEIPYNKNSFGFSFARPGYIGAYNVRCMLEGYDAKWKSLDDDKSIYYYNVPPGEYTLKIEGHKDVVVVVIPPFWSSVKGIVLIVLLSLLACTVIIYIIFRRREKIAQEQEKEKMISEKLNFMSGFVALEQFDTMGNEADFMKRFDEVITSHLSDEGFTVEQLAKELSMSHTSLGRYTLSAFGTSPVNYIRTKRLAVASHLLLQGGLSVSDIAFRCGFSTPAYFSKCFKDAYGVTPSQYNGGGKNRT
jgi:ligand-binding sensor domain-containing protein/AraC-like DNA-binding protein